MPAAESNIARLEAKLGTNWPAIRKAQLDTASLQHNLTSDDLQSSPDTSVVVFGSIARKEVTSGSDLDWILLVDARLFQSTSSRSGK